MEMIEKKYKIGFIIGSLMLIIAGVIYPITDSVTVVLLEDNISLQPGTLFYVNWENPKPEVLFQFWMFEIENFDEFGKQNKNQNGEYQYVKPIVKDKGPYSYKELYQKIEINQENGAYDNSSWIEYRQKRTFIFDPETSCDTCNKDDQVKNINLVAVAVYGIINNLFHTRPRFAEKRDEEVVVCCKKRKIPSITCNNDDDFIPCYGIPSVNNIPDRLYHCGDPELDSEVTCKSTGKTFYDFVMGEINSVLKSASTALVDDTKTVDEILFGFSDPIFEALADRLTERGMLSEDDQIVELFRNLEYGIFKARNETSGWDHFKVRNGNGNDCVGGNCIKSVAEIRSWEGKTDLSPWYGDDRISYCNRIEGTDGQSTFPFLSKNTRIEIFVGDICRNIYMDFEKEYIYSGPDGTFDPIPGYMYRTPESVFESKSSPENRCYCSPNLPTSPVDWCSELDGFSMIDQCQFGAPAIASAPHFLKADPYFHEKIGGMKPLDVDHVSYIVYEPTSGSIIKNAKRMQINFLLTPNPELEFMTIEDEAIPVPMFWLNETMALDEETAGDVYQNSVLPMKIVSSIQYTLFAVGGALVLVTSVIIIIKLISGPASVEDDKKEELKMESIKTKEEENENEL